MKEALKELLYEEVNNVITPQLIKELLSKLSELERDYGGTRAQ